jgi:pyrimidine operon attenuation protein/uracil phosphoribosyltransferase
VLLANMSEALTALLNDRAIEAPCMIGIHTGGAWIAKELHAQLSLSQPLGTLNITFYRDDFTRIGMHPQVEPSNLPFDVEDQHIVLVDDVLHTGRTIRAALNEIFDYGRPASVILVALVERSGRELPICADIVGVQMTLEEHQHIKLTGPEPLKLSLQESA